MYSQCMYCKTGCCYSNVVFL